MTHITLDLATEPRFAGLRAWIAALLRRRRAGDSPSRFTDAELLELHECNLGHRPISSEAIVQIGLRAGMWGRY